MKVFAFTTLLEHYIEVLQINDTFTMRKYNLKIPQILFGTLKRQYFNNIRFLRISFGEKCSPGREDRCASATNRCDNDKYQ